MIDSVVLSVGGEDRLSLLQVDSDCRFYKPILITGCAFLSLLGSQCVVNGGETGC